jgi:hypothetical protein
MPQIRVGTLRLLIDGVQYAIAGDFNIDPLSEKREPVVGWDGSGGMKVERKLPMIEGQIRDTDGLDVQALVSQRDVTITAEMENGKAWVLRNAFFSGDGTVDPGEGTIAARWHGESIDEVR